MCYSCSATTPGCTPRRSPSVSRESLPAFYSDITPEAVRSQLATVGVVSKEVREPRGVPRAGFERAAVIAAVGSSDE